MTNWFRSAFGAAILFAALLLMAPPTSAQTLSCSDELGAALGLCQSYCEAMDCDGVPQATQAACDSVQAKWFRQTGINEIPCGAGSAPGDLPLTAGTPFDSMCPFDDTTLFPENPVAEICASLGPEVTYFFPGSANDWAVDSPAATSANICLCPDSETAFNRSIRRCLTGQPNDPCAPVDAADTPVLLNVDSITSQRVGAASCSWTTFNFLGTNYEVLICV